MQISSEVISRSVVSLPRYAKLIGYRECAFFGVSHEENIAFACREIWTKSQRDDISAYLQEAQEAIERVLEYPLEPKWIADERHDLNSILITDWGKVIEPGIRAEEELSGDLPVNVESFGAPLDTFTVSFISPSVIDDLSEVHVYYPDSDIEIYPSEITYDEISQLLTILIPRCRMVAYDMFDNPPEGLLYTDNDNFQDTVDVKRIYTDNSIQAKLIYRPEACPTDCTESYDNVCIFMDTPAIGKIRVSYGYPSTCKQYSHVELNYKAGAEELTRTMESMVIRLAHSMMPTEPCGCDVTQRLWMRDREIPKILTKERIECPFGMSDGAWIAWKWACGLQLNRLSTLIGKRKL